MPLTLTISEGALPEGTEETVFAQLSDAMLEWKVPSFAFNTRELQQGYFAEATEIVHQASNGKLPKSNIWINVVHAVDGAWGIAGQAMTNAELSEAISEG